MAQLLKPLIEKLIGALLLISLSQITLAAGPRAKDLYIKLGGGILTPTFEMKEGYLHGVDGPPLGSTTTSLGGETAFFTIIGTTDDIENRIENKSILALGGSAGYQLNSQLGIEVHINLGFINFALRDTFVDALISEGKEAAGTVHLLPPPLLPVGLSLTYSPFPNQMLSPYLGVGGLLALLDNRRAGSPPTDIITWNGAPELGVLIHGGLHLDISKDWFAYLDIKYGYVEEPDIIGKNGDPVPVDFFEFRHFSVGGGKRF